MWYFMVKQSMQFLEPGIYGLALSRILHSSDTSIFLLFWFHIKLDNSVAFCLFLYLKESFLFIYYLIFYIVLYSLMYYILHSYIVLHIKYIALLLWDLSSLYVVVHLQSLLINTYPCCISKDIFVMQNFFTSILIITSSNPSPLVRNSSVLVNSPSCKRQEVQINLLTTPYKHSKLGYLIQFQNQRL